MRKTNLCAALSNPNTANDWRVVAPVLEPIIFELSGHHAVDLPVEFGVTEHMDDDTAGLHTGERIYVRPHDYPEPFWLYFHVNTILHETGHHTWNPSLDAQFPWLEEANALNRQLRNLPANLLRLFAKSFPRAYRTLRLLCHASLALDEAQAMLFAIMGMTRFARLSWDEPEIMWALDISWVDLLSQDCQSPLLTMWLARNGASTEIIGDIARFDAMGLASELRDSFKPRGLTWGQASHSLSRTLGRRRGIARLVRNTKRVERSQQYHALLQHRGLSLLLDTPIRDQRAALQITRRALRTVAAVITKE